MKPFETRCDALEFAKQHPNQYLSCLVFNGFEIFQLDLCWNVLPKSAYPELDNYRAA